MNYVEIMKNLIENGKREFTHHEIINITNTNCPYGVLRQLKNYYELEYTVETRNNKKYRKYTILKRKEKDVKKSNIR